LAVIKSTTYLIEYMKAELKIVMLEDSVVDAEIIQRFLLKEKLDCQFSLASNKAAFLLALDQFKPDLILADNALPQFNGSEALKIVCEAELDIPFILVTGTMTDEFAAHIIKSGADDYILKDRLTRLPDAIQAALKKRKTEKEKQQAIQKLVQSEEKYRSLLESAPDAMVIVNRVGIIQLINAQTENMFGYTGKEIIGEYVGILLPDRYKKPNDPNHFESTDVTQLGDGFELCGKKNDGAEFPVELRLSRLETAEGLIITATIRDITERRMAEKALQEMEREMLNQKIQEQKKITRAIIKAQEKERNRIGQELHDNVNQILVGTKLYLEMARKDDLKVKELIKYSIGLIQSSINEIRLLSTKNVTPLKDINLKELLQQLVDELNKTTQIKMALVYEVQGKTMDDDLKLNIYRIVQEQVNNIVRHSSAENAFISVRPDDNHIVVAVNDDGKGFDTGKKRKGIGISNMINRIESFNGEVRIESSVGNGCDVEVKLPY